MTKADDAVALFQQGFNCTQSILSVFAPDFGLDQDTARRISHGFGAGIARMDKNLWISLWSDYGDRAAIRWYKG